MNRRLTLSSGFTIVELLVVIVVIGILAAITIVSYTGITQRAIAASLSADLNSASKILKLDQVQSSSGSFPADLATANGGRGIVLNSDPSPQYYAGNTNQPFFCISATQGGQNYYTNQDTTPSAGDCLVTNLIANPSAEANLVPPNASYFSPTVSVDSTKAMFGIRSIKVTTNSAVQDQGLIWTAPDAKPNTQYTCSVYLTGTVGKELILSGRAETEAYDYIAEGYDSKSVILTASWQRVSVTFVSPANAGYVDIQYYPYPNEVGVEVWGDGAMCTEGPVLYDYADGSSAGWSWSGTANASASSGLPL